MRPLTLLMVIPALMLAASAPAQSGGETLDTSLRRARAEQARAEAQAARLERAVANARGEAERLHAEQAAAAQAIEAAEARITAAGTQLELASAYVAAHRSRLAQEQRPLSALLAGLAVMAQRPPLLALADQGSTDDFVKVRILLDSTLPVIRRRTSLIAAQLTQGQRLEREARSARAELVDSQHSLMARRQRFAALERRAIEAAASAGGEALSAGDVALAVGEDVERLQGSESASQAAAAAAARLASEETLARPLAPDSGAPRLPFAYALPAAAPVIEGLGSVNASGVSSRGITLATARGASVTAPAAGLVRFAGPFRDYDGIVILDHGGGCISLIVNVASPLKRGDKVALGTPLGRALGPIQVELSQNGRRLSPALIAGSSQTLSKGGKGG